MVNDLARYTEADWNVDSIPQVEEKGVEADGMHSYLASKTLAEKALWSELGCMKWEGIFAQAERADFVEDEKPSWDAVAINPPYVLGEVIHQCDKPEKLNTSVGKCANLFQVYSKWSSSDSFFQSLLLVLACWWEDRKGPSQSHRQLGWCEGR